MYKKCHVTFWLTLSLPHAYDLKDPLHIKLKYQQHEIKINSDNFFNLCVDPASIDEEDDSQNRWFRFSNLFCYHLFLQKYRKLLSRRMTVINLTFTKVA